MPNWPATVGDPAALGSLNPKARNVVPFASRRLRAHVVSRRKRAHARTRQGSKINRSQYCWMRAAHTRRSVDREQKRGASPHGPGRVCGRLHRRGGLWASPPPGKKQPRRTLRSSRSLISRFPRAPRNNARSPAIPSCSGCRRVPRDALRPLKRPVGAFLTLGPSGLYVHYIRTRTRCQGVRDIRTRWQIPYRVLAFSAPGHAKICASEKRCRARPPIARDRQHTGSPARMRSCRKLPDQNGRQRVPLSLRLYPAARLPAGS